MNKPNTANSQGNFGEDKESSVINHTVKLDIAEKELKQNSLDQK